MKPKRSAPGLLDAYKTGHVLQYPNNTQYILSNFTPRASRNPNIKEVVFFGLQYYIKKYLIQEWADTFFELPKNIAVNRYQKYVDMGLGDSAPPTDHIEALWELGHLPIQIRALPEGTLVPLRVPMYTVRNTHPDFAWITNFLETQMSTVIWSMCTSATIANQFRLVFDKYASLTGDLSFCPWQGHDFSMRGMSSIESAITSGAAHLTSFLGTDTFPAFPFLEEFYKGEGQFLGGSVPATEHAVVCANGIGKEKETLTRLLTKVYPEGIFSYVADTWDFWELVTKTLPSIKDIIMGRNGKLVIRPDSGDPVKILIGDSQASTEEERKGLIECLWDIFGGTINDKGYKQLDSHIGAIYGDSINLERQDLILHGLMGKGFSSSNIVLGIGSYTYQYNTRDTFGFAVKATHAVIDDQSYDIYKAPKTDNGVKNSAKGRVMVVKNGLGKLSLVDQISEQQFNSLDNLLVPVFENGHLLIEHDIEEIRTLLEEQRLKQLIH